jgi:hypothetical protein
MRCNLWRVLPPAALVLALLGTTDVAPAQDRKAADAKAPAKYVPKFDPVAETKLLMEGLNQANFRGLERQLKQKPADAEAWTFARGQALLIAETGNLLLLRPPRGQEAQEAWMKRSTEMREAAAALAKQAGSRDYERSLTALGALADTCNRCHQTFRVPTRIGPGAEPEERGKERGTD